jgi:hypothetical protein
MLRNKYRNSLLEELIKAGFSPNEFEVQQGEDRLSLALKIKSAVVFNLWNTEYSFDRFFVSFSRYTPTFKEKSAVDNVEFAAVCDHFNHWLSDVVKKVKEDVNDSTPNKWDLLDENAIVVDAIDFTTDEPFSAIEQGKMNLALEEAKKLIQEQFNPSDAQLALINQKISYLIQATTRVNKTDWKNILVSTVIAIGYDLALSPEKRDVLFSLFSKVWDTLKALPPVF